MGKYKLKIIFDKIEGNCHVHEEGDSFTVESDGQTIHPDNTEKICLHAISSISTLLPVMSKDISENDKTLDKRCVRCPDPGPEEGGSGKAYMKIIRERVED